MRLPEDRFFWFVVGLARMFPRLALWIGVAFVFGYIPYALGWSTGP